MIVTEEEAKTKYCQESFGPGSGSWETTPAQRRCMGSTCMAWRWHFNGDIRNIDRGQNDDRSLGFCGLAGR